MPDEQLPLPSDPVRPGAPPYVPVDDRLAAPPVPVPHTLPSAPPPPPRKAQQPGTELKDGTREIIETIVFVVVLVLLLKTFLAEAFVIPTGSMATTLLGYHKEVTCQQCGYTFPVNASDEVEKRGDPVVGAVCPNCRFPNELVPRNGDGRNMRP